MSSPRHAPPPGRHATAPGRPEVQDHPGHNHGENHLEAHHQGTPGSPDEITRDGAAWLTSAGTYPRTTLARWTASPTAPLVLPCGTSFDVVSVPAAFGCRVLDRLLAEGPATGPGPVATHRGRTLLFATPGTAHRLPSLLRWEEWGTAGGCPRPAVPPLLCHGPGDAVTVPPLTPGAGHGPRWLIAPRTRRPWLPGPDVLRWACARAARSEDEDAEIGSTGSTEIVSADDAWDESAEGTEGAEGAIPVSIFPTADLGASVYDVSRRR